MNTADQGNNSPMSLAQPVAIPAFAMLISVLQGGYLALQVSATTYAGIALVFATLQLLRAITCLRAKSNRFLDSVAVLLSVQVAAFVAKPDARGSGTFATGTLSPAMKGFHQSSSSLFGPGPVATGRGARYVSLDISEFRASIAGLGLTWRSRCD